jgi:hypothetical protein
MNEVHSKKCYGATAMFKTFKLLKLLTLPRTDLGTQKCKNKDLGDVSF